MSIDNQIPAATPFPEGQQFPAAAFPPPVAPKKKGGKGKWVLAAIVVAAIIGGTQAAKSGSTTTSSIGSSSSANVISAPSTYKVTYKVTGTARTVDLTLQTANGGTSQQSDVALPVMNQNGAEGLTFTMKKGDFAYISAQNQGSTGSVTCTIELDGVPAVTNTSSGEYVIATCSGRV